MEGGWVGSSPGRGRILDRIDSRITGRGNASRVARLERGRDLHQWLQLALGAVQPARIEYLLYSRQMRGNWSTFGPESDFGT